VARSPAESLPPALVGFAQFPLARWSEIGAPPLLCGRGRFMVPELEDLETLATVRDLLLLAHRRGILARTWLRDAPKALSAGLAPARISAEALSRAYAYALRASSARSLVRTLADPTAQRLLPFVTWRAFGSEAPWLRDPHAELEGRIAGSGEGLCQALAPPLGYDCTCYLGVVNLAKARRLGPLRSDLRAAELRALAPPGWDGAPPAIDPLDEAPARAAIGRASSLLEAAGLSWPQGRGVSAGTGPSD